MKAKEKQLSELLDAQKWDEAKELLDSYLNAPLSLEEKGAAYVAFVTTYLEMVNRVQEQYLAELDNLLEQIKITKREELETVDELRRIAVQKDA